jgi:uncharacterized protein YyaL (SSP411 family)
MIFGAALLIIYVDFALADSGKQPSLSAKPASEEKTKYNRLINESSPYLQQHATNPIDWYPWSAEAFERAKREDKPIFLSIGYSTCHWCHVMEHESFSDFEVAALLNRHFVSIKVDREERPDIDKIYMTVTQAMTGRGGWPMSVILTPDKKPFFAGTYFPKSSRWGRPGLMDLLPKIVDVWRNDRENVLKNADQITDLLIRLSNRKPGEVPDAQILAKAQNRLVEIYDPEFGGFGKAPKFPTPHILTFLLRQYHHSGEKKLLAMVEKTLKEMRMGGIFDQVGFGFHRYSTDARWRVPHFEKMLYDQALLAIAYIEAYQVTGNSFYARTAREIFTYILRDMTASEGGFYSAQDADSEGVEGKFYLWSFAQIQEILTQRDAQLYQSIFNISVDGNFASPDHEGTNATNIPHLKKPLSEISKDLKLPQADLQNRLERIRQKLFQTRKNRIHPFKDDKILTDWNGLMIAALAKAGKVFDDPHYTRAAHQAADFVLDRLRDDNGRLLKRYRQGKAGVAAQLSDYAFVTWGLLELYENTYKTRFLKEAVGLNDLMLAHFWDHKNGGFFMTADDGETILVRHKDVYDGAIPAGNSVALLNLMRLSRMTGNKDYAARAEKIVKAFAADIQGYPAGHAQFMAGLIFALNLNYEIVIVGKAGAKDTLDMLAALRREFMPETVVLFIPTDQITASEINNLAPFTRSMKALNNRATAYVCQDFYCKLPTNSIGQMLANLKAMPTSSGKKAATQVVQ